MQTIRCHHLLGPHECRMGACSIICVRSQIALDFGLQWCVKTVITLITSFSYVEGRRGKYNLKSISAWHHCIVYSFINVFVNHAKIYPGLIWMVCYGAVLVAGLQLDSIGEPSCTGNPTGPVTKGWAGSEHTSMSADNDVDRLRRLHHRSAEIQRRSLNKAREFFPPRMDQCDKESANKTRSSQFMLFSVL